MSTTVEKRDTLNHMNTRRRLAPPGTRWYTPTEIPTLPLGTALYLDTAGHRERPRGRLTAASRDEITLATCTTDSERTFAMSQISRARVIPSPLSDGDLVLKRGVPAAVWRGGIIRLGINPDTDNPGAYVEGTDGVHWIDEARLISAEVSSRSLLTSRRGRIPTGAEKRAVAELREQVAS